MKSDRILLGITLVTFIISYGCKDSSPVQPVDDAHYQQQLADFSVEQVGYDSLHVGSANDIIVKDRAIRTVIFGRDDNGTFVALDTVSASYTPTNNSYFLNFQFAQSLNRTYLYFDLVIRFNHEAGRFYDFPRQIPMFKWPYATAEVFLESEDVFPGYPQHFQDFDFNPLANELYCTITGPTILYRHDLTTNATTELYSYGGGNFVTYDSGYIFFDIAGHVIARFSVAADTVDLDFLYVPGENYVAGLDIYDGLLYVLYRSDTYSIIQYTLGGEYVDGIDYGEHSIFMSIADDIVYCIKRTETGTWVLSRFNLNTQTFLPDLTMPTPEWEGIRVRDEILYYVDFFRKYIGMVPLADLF